MPRKPRVEDAGYHHIINRGVARSKIFLKDKDYEKFLEILEKTKEIYSFNIHSFCLMNNHYHLLIEIQHNNLSLIARQINSKYAQYFNKEYKRAGPLWQGRFKNYYVYNENYLYMLYKYIEQNPIKAKISKTIGEYKWCASTLILNKEYQELLKASDLMQKELLELVGKKLTNKELEELENLQKTTYKKEDDKIIRLRQTSLEDHFKEYKNKRERNQKILIAFKDGYTQSDIARYLNLTNAGVSYVIKNFKFDT